MSVKGFMIPGLLALILISASACQSRQYVFSVNGIKVETEELQYHMELLKTEVMTGFEEAQADIESADFWHTDFGGEIPVETLRNRAAQAVILVKVQQLEAKSRGIGGGYIYDSQYRKAWETENNRRMKAIQQGEPVYGPDRLEFHFYFSGQMEQLKTDLRSELKDSFSITEEEMKGYYRAHPETFKDEGGGTLSYEKSAAGIYNTLLDDRYNAFIQELADKASVVYFDSFDAAEL